MGTKLYVGNLSASTAEKDLQLLFGGVGEVLNCEIAVDPQKGKSLGYAIVEMKTAADSNKAIEQCDGAVLDGRVLAVKEAGHDIVPDRKGFSGSSEGRGFVRFKSGRGSRRGIRRAKRARKGAK